LLPDISDLVLLRGTITTQIQKYKHTLFVSNVGSCFC
jgi:hypothetical protein